MNDTQNAIDFLKLSTHSHTGEHIYHTVEEIHNVIQATCGIPALARNLRRHRSYGELLSRRRSLKKYMEYSYNEVAQYNTKEVQFTSTQCKIQYKSCADRIDKINNDFLNKYLAPILIKIKEIVGI